jgi:hypothetical protein
MRAATSTASEVAGRASRDSGKSVGNAAREVWRQRPPVTVYVDQARNPLGRMIMCHMVADTLDELHAMAAAIGMRPEWFQPRSFPHYDVSQTRRTAALKLGAVEVDRRELVSIIRRLRPFLPPADGCGA